MGQKGMTEEMELELSWRKYLWEVEQGGTNMTFEEWRSVTHWKEE